jgi:hypothetical protein
MATKSKTAKKRQSLKASPEKARVDEKRALARATRLERELSRLAKQLPRLVRKREEDLTELIDVLEAFGYRSPRAAAPAPDDAEGES